MPVSKKRANKGATPKTVACTRGCGRSFTSGNAMEQHLAKCNGGKSGRKAGSGKGGSFQPFMGGGEGRRNLLREDMSKALGTTETGSLWALRYLHPCDETRAGGERIPDTTSAETAAPELRVRSLIDPPAGVTTTWDCAIFQFPVAELACVILKRVAGEANWVMENSVEFPATPVQLMAADVAPAAPNVFQTYVNEFRATYQGLTAHLNAPQLADQGVLYAAQWAAKADTGEGTYGTPPVSDIPRLHFTGVPGSPDTLYQKSSKVVQMPAREGIYIPLRFTDPVSEYATVDNLPGPVRIFLDGDPNPTFTLGSDGTVTAGVTNGSKFFTASPLNMNCSVAFFMGIDKAATIDLKVRKGVQCVPSASSPWGPFMEDSPRVDTAALSRVVTVAQEGALAYPARYNDLSLLWSKVIAPLLKGGVRLGLPFLQNWANG